MALDQECRHPEEKKSLREEDKKEEKKSPPKTCYVLKKRAEFLDIRKKGKTIYAQFFIINYFLSSQSDFYFGLTVSRKIGNAVKRNYLKRIIRSIVVNNLNSMPKNTKLEIIPKKQIEKKKYSELEKDFLDTVKNLVI